MKKDIIVITEIQNSKIQPVTFEVIACAEKIAERHPADIYILIINTEPERFAEEISRLTNHKIVAIQTPNSKYYNSHIFKNSIADTISELNPWFICAGHTSQGIDFAPGLAVKLNCACITAINDLSIEEDSFIFSRSVFGGKLNAFIKSASSTTVLTIQQGSFKKTQIDTGAGQIIHKTSNESSERISTTGISKPETIQSALSEAKTVVAFGRGVLEPENIPLVEKFSLHFSGSALACSRPVVDMGWMKYRYQVGITGTVISPEIYIACGISGSSQHIAGMNGSGFVVAINSDPNAAIFNYADICVVEDMFGFFEAFEKNIRL